MEGNFLGGADILAYLVLAIGGAMAIGSIMAVIRPPQKRKDGDLQAAPIGRSIVFAAVGLVAALWALATLVAG